MATRRTAKKTVAASQQANLNITNRYDAAGTGRRMKGWNAPSSGPNRAIVGLQNIRNRSHDAVRNDWTGTSGAQHWTTNLVGTGIIPRLSKIASAVKKTRYTKLLTDWSKVCDADNVLNMFGQQTLASRSWIIGGEVFGRLRSRRIDSGLPVPLQVQIIEAEFVPLLDADTYPGMPSGNRIRSGIELNRIGQRVAYWVYKQHPGDNQGNQSIDASTLVRVPANQMIHMFEPKRPGQLRGVPDFAPILARLRNIADFDDAVLDRQKLVNLIAAFVERPVATTMDDGTDPLTGLPIEYDANGAPMVGWEPGMVQELAPGEKMSFSNPPEAGTTYSEYMRSQQLGTAAGQGLPYEIMSGDIANVSDRTLRVVMNEFRRYAEQRQWQILIPMWCQKIHDAWVDAGVVSGVIDIADADLLKDVEWAPQGWAYIHPVQDVQAKQTEVEAGFRSRSSVISERGDDPEAVDAEIAKDRAREKKLDINFGAVPATPNGKPAKAKSENDNIAPGEYPRNHSLDNLTSTVARLETFVHNQASDTSAIEHFVAGLAGVTTCVSEIAASVAALASRPTEVRVTNEVNPTPVTVENNVAATNVAVTNEVQPTPVTIENNVAAPNVAVTNTVQPAEVTVNLPDRQTSSIIERDPDGNIKTVTQTERTLQ